MAKSDPRSGARDPLLPLLEEIGPPEAGMKIFDPYTHCNYLTEKYAMLSKSPVYPALGAGICRDTLSTMPISTSCKHSAVPP